MSSILILKHAITRVQTVQTRALFHIHGKNDKKSQILVQIVIPFWALQSIWFEDHIYHFEFQKPVSTYYK